MATRGHRPVAPPLPGVLVKGGTHEAAELGPGSRGSLLVGQGKVTSAEAEGLHSWPVGQWGSQSVGWGAQERR